MSSCRFCGNALTHTFVNLGGSPLANSYLSSNTIHAMEPFYPLHVYVCEKCFLVQLEEFESPKNIFSDYLYFSSFSDEWLAHAKRYVEEITSELSLGTSSKVVEVASNDGYLLKNFVEKKIPVLGVEPAANVAEVAKKKGIPCEVAFFGVETAKRLLSQGHQADLMLGNNVLAHVPDINDFVGGFAVLLKEQGVVTFEFPHLLNLITLNQFDTIYHEHFSYLSLLFVQQLFRKHGLRVWKVKELPTHGGSLRVYGCREQAKYLETKAVAEVLEKERALSLHTLEGYQGYGERVLSCKEQFVGFLADARRHGKKVMAYGAPAKGNTFLCYAGVRSDQITLTADRSPHKQNHFLPGSHIPIRSPEDLLAARPDYVVILPWNLRNEISTQLSEIRSWGGKFVVAIPELEIF